MSTVFDPDAGLLRIRHGALAVLALLASEPTSTRLHDHDVAPVIAELRDAGLLGRSGIHPAVAPLAETVARAGTVADVGATEHGTPHRLRVWIGRGLAVIGTQTAPEAATYELLADHPRQLSHLLGELLGLGVAPDPPVSGTRTLASGDFEVLVTADATVAGDAVAAALGTGPEDPWARALTAGLRGAAVRWRLRAHRAGELVTDLTVLDAGLSGLWLARCDDDRVTVAATQASAVRAELARLVE